MKRLVAGLLLCCVAGSASSYHTDDASESTKADTRASCNAAFHVGCQADQTFTASSSGFAAPAGALGSSGLESALVALLLAGGIGRGLYRARAGRGRRGNPHTAPGQPGSAGRGTTRQDRPLGESCC